MTKQKTYLYNIFIKMITMKLEKRLELLKNSIVIENMHLKHSRRAKHIHIPKSKI